MKIGLTLGKYAPLHKGHEHVIRIALREMDHVIVMIYNCPETTPIPLPVRSTWIRELFPFVEVLEAPDGPTVVGDTPAIRKLNEDYILRRVAHRGITHFYSSEFYGRHVSQVDPERIHFPVSGTAIRSDPYVHRHFLSPRVYRDLIQKVVFLGAPSTGKTTLAQALAQRFNTTWMPEYGREYWDAQQVNRRLTPAQLVHIAEEHLRREEEMTLEANRFLFIDTNALTTYLFARYYHGHALPRLQELADLAASRCEHVFLCGDDIPYQNSWDRSGEVNRATLQQQTLAELLRRRIDHHRLPPSHEARVQRVAKVLHPAPFRIST